MGGSKVFYIVWKQRQGFEIHNLPLCFYLRKEMQAQISNTEAKRDMREREEEEGRQTKNMTGAR